MIIVCSLHGKTSDLQTLRTSVDASGEKAAGVSEMQAVSVRGSCDLAQAKQFVITKWNQWKF